MSADDVIALPLAFSGQRLDWRDLPRHVRTRIAELAGAQVTAEISATSGFSPGLRRRPRARRRSRRLRQSRLRRAEPRLAGPRARRDPRRARAAAAGPCAAAAVVLRRRRLGHPRLRGGARALARAAVEAGRPAGRRRRAGSARRRRAAARPRAAAHRRPAGRRLHRLAQAARARRGDAGARTPSWPATSGGGRWTTSSSWSAGSRSRCACAPATRWCTATCAPTT